MGHTFSAKEYAVFATTGALYLAITDDLNMAKHTYVLHLSDATINYVRWFSKTGSSISYKQMSGIEITPDAIFISIENQLHVYGKCFIIYLYFSLMSFEQSMQNNFPL